LAPRRLASPLHSLPPILDNASQTPTSSCSKGSRGLSVQPRVLGIFTETAVSPDPSLRQRPSRYAIRAGRNFAFIPCFQGRRLSLHYVSDRRLIEAIDLAARPGTPISHPKMISRYGVKLRFEPTSHGIALSLLRRPWRRVRGGFPRYEPVRACPYPTRNFATLGRL
jgi:hypothetical protein